MASVSSNIVENGENFLQVTIKISPDGEEGYLLYFSFKFS